MIRANNRNLQLFVFILIYLVAISPVLFYKYFPTVDGPAHLYNAKILRELFLGDAEFYKSFFSLNNMPVPNWTGHFIAVVSGIMLPVWMIEKLLILIITCCFPLSLIYLSKSYGGQTSWHMFLVLPFIYSITLYLGFFNFMIALPLMFLFLGHLKRGKFNIGNKGLAKMMVLAILIYFSHLMVFILTFGFSIIEIFRSSLLLKEAKLISKNAVLKCLTFIPGILLSVWFFEGRGVEGFKNTVDILPTEQLWKWILEGSPLVGLNGEKEVPSTTIFVYGMFSLFLYIGIARIFRKSGWVAADIILVFAGLMLIFYFVVPDGIASGGFVSLRFLLLFMVFITTWIITHKLPFPVSIAAGILGIYVSFSTLSYRHEVARQLSSDAQNIISVSEQLKPQSVLLPLNYSENWLHINISNYIGANNKVIVLDNYEAVLNEFPLRWNASKAPALLTGNFASSLNPVVTIEKYENATGVKINYVSRWHFSSSGSDSIKNSTSATLNAIYGNPVSIERCDLFGK